MTFNPPLVSQSDNSQSVIIQTDLHISILQEQHTGVRDFTDDREDLGKSAGPSTISVLAIGLSSKVAADRQILASAEWRDHVLDEWTILTGE